MQPTAAGQPDGVDRVLKTPDADGVTVEARKETSAVCSKCRRNKIEPELFFRQIHNGLERPVVGSQGVKVVVSGQIGRCFMAA